MSVSQYPGQHTLNLTPVPAAASRRAMMRVHAMTPALEVP
eukprot:CAMPEP_0175809176 /NCGR_PEP_ID=MMETSP0107_2-20121207/2656_1 /TAXON_ID=195067 ORGANISM="Goniomonas pacifica, Strain CCMP1869" /NCGR_SAMPLE_ID=MMETSP0107_2 /ASSEMBLY_ACC=CAM_ASM_000203 /LENGTH=39 /DNA_ID= /DNA_START= /DNA_END= /DNA_ORIENTATION=